MVENGKESRVLYYIHSFPSGINFGKVNFVKFCVYKLTWHSRLGHPVDQALNSLKDKLYFYNDSLPPYDVFHKAKQTRDSFSLRVTSKLGELIHLNI